MLEYNNDAQAAYELLRQKEIVRWSLNVLQLKV